MPPEVVIETPAVQAETGQAPSTGVVEEVVIPAKGESAAPESATENGDAEGEPNDELSAQPEWVRKVVKDARKEAANYRTQLRDSEARLAAAKTVDEFNAATESLRANVTQLERALISEKYRLPAELAELVKGANYEEMETHAKLLAKFAPVMDEQVDVSGGLTPRVERGVDKSKADLVAEYNAKHNRRF